MKIIPGEQVAALERICVYGGPKMWKTRLVTSLPWGPYWGERAVYFAADPDSEYLKSTLPEHAKHISVIQKELQPSVLEEAVLVATTDWKEQGYGTLIWDTMTQTSNDLLFDYSDSGVFSEKHAVQLGRKGTKSWHTSPMEGDYGAAQNSIAFLLKHLFKLPVHVIVVFHEKWVEPKAGSPEGVIGGPDVAGRKAVAWISGQFDTVFRTDMGVDPKTRQKGGVVQTVPRGIWKAGYRTKQATQGLEPAVLLDPDPVEFWKRYEREMRGGK